MFQAPHGSLHSTAPLHLGFVFVVKIWKSSRYSKTQSQNSSRMVHVIHSHTPTSDRYFASFSFFAAEDWDWSASIGSYDADGCGVLHSVARQSSTILLMSSEFRNGIG